MGIAVNNKDTFTLKFLFICKIMKTLVVCCLFALSTSGCFASPLDLPKDVKMEDVIYDPDSLISDSGSRFMINEDNQVVSCTNLEDNNCLTAKYEMILQPENKGCYRKRVCGGNGFNCRWIRKCGAMNLRDINSPLELPKDVKMENVIHDPDSLISDSGSRFMINEDNQAVSCTNLEDNNCLMVKSEMTLQGENWRCYKRWLCFGPANCQWVWKCGFTNNFD